MSEISDPLDWQQNLIFSHLLTNCLSLTTIQFNMLRYYLYRSGKIPTSVHPFVKQELLDPTNTTHRFQLRRILGRIQIVIFPMLRVIFCKKTKH